MWSAQVVLTLQLLSSLQGYLEAQGKFEGDDFETLFVRVDTEKVQLQVLIAQGLPVLFDLSTKAFVFEDSADPTSIILDYRGNIVVFKVRCMLLTAAVVASNLVRQSQLVASGLYDYVLRAVLICCRCDLASLMNANCLL
jgi:hypothetical protein